jgi:hypothetical protein
MVPASLLKEIVAVAAGAGAGTIGNSAGGPSRQGPSGKAGKKCKDGCKCPNCFKQYMKFQNKWN